MTLDAWLERIERLHVRPIDLSLERVREVAQRLALQLDCAAIIVGGTNGKGSTCAMLDSILRSAGYRIGLYTSPHLLRFNERAQIDGAAANDATLVAQFEAVEAARGDTPLTYFEFSTLAILRLFAQSCLDAAILEIGLGGRLDAVNLVDADCAIVTSIDLDHMDYLGDTRERIGWEKAHIYRTRKPAICADPRPPQSLIEHAAAIGSDLWRFGRDFNYPGDRQQWAYGGRSQRRSGLPYPALRGANQLLNAAGALAALEALAARLPVSQQAVRQGLLTVEIAARFQVMPGQPAVIFDVAHNPHAAAVLAQNLDGMGFYPRTFAVFGMLRDKDIAGVARRVAGRIDRWFVGPTAGSRGTDAAQMREALQAAGVACDAIEFHDDLASAYAGARDTAAPEDRILVFGSFVTVAEVMRARSEG